MSLHGSRTQSGQAALEMALTMPLVFVLIMGVLELGLAFNAYVTVAAAAREGARAGAIYLYDSAYSQAANDQNRESGTGTGTPYTENIRDTVQASLGILKTSPSNFNKATDVTISYTPQVDPINTRKGSIVTVQVTYRYAFLTQVLPTPSTITMQARASARIE